MVLKNNIKQQQNLKFCPCTIKKEFLKEVCGQNKTNYFLWIARRFKNRSNSNFFKNSSEQQDEATKFFISLILFRIIVSFLRRYAG